MTQMLMCERSHQISDSGNIGNGMSNIRKSKKMLHCGNLIMSGPFKVVCEIVGNSNNGLQGLASDNDFRS